ncbi:hypothetical protein TWF730_001189 [Orbilia blumenaviensis]|uniref:C2H2-type domain-containing protein n=1 Tax=Orbilia blumenaviensis TaxID=1796055 RepID=A0AAV9VNU4_9PEZI
MPCCGCFHQNQPVEARRRSRRHGFADNGIQHLRDHICHVCGNAFHSALEVEEHFKIAHGYPCGTCQKKCRSSGGLKLHQKIHRFPANDSRNEEDIVYRSRASQPPPRRSRPHRQDIEAYNDDGSIEPNTPNLPAPRVCHTCTRPFRRTSAYLRHLENSRCGPGKTRIYEVIRKLDTNNLITPPIIRRENPFKRLWLCFLCPQDPGF